MGKYRISSNDYKPKGIEMNQISIIVPVYNVMPYLTRCIDSILNQSYSEFELILIDDGSNDGSGEKCDEFSEMDSRIVVIHKVNGGVSSARNAGLDWAFKNSKSKWIVMIDGDDWIQKDYLFCLFETVTKLKCDCAVVGFQRTSEVICQQEDCFLKKAPNLVKMTPDDFLGRDFKFNDVDIPVIAPWGKIYKKELFKNIRYPEGKIHEDRFTTHRVLFNSFEIGINPIPMYYYYVNTKSITQKTWNPKRLDDLDAVKEQILFFKNKKACKSYLESVRNYYDILIYQFRQFKNSNYRKSIKYSLLFKKEILLCTTKYKDVLKLDRESKIKILLLIFPLLKHIKLNKWIKSI